MADKNKQSESLEETPEIEVGNSNIGKFNLILYAIITLICIIYFFVNLQP